MQSSLLQQKEPIQYYDDEEEDEEEDAGARQDEEDSDEGDRRPAKRKRMPVPRPTAGTPAKAESLEEVEQRLQPGSVKHAIFQVWSLPYPRPATPCTDPPPLPGHAPPPPSPPWCSSEESFCTVHRLQLSSIDRPLIFKIFLLPVIIMFIDETSVPEPAVNAASMPAADSRGMLLVMPAWICICSVSWQASVSCCSNDSP